MTDTVTETPQNNAEPPEGSARSPWYRRRTPLIVAGVVLVVGISVLSDLPVHASRSANVSSAQSVMKEVNGDLAPCALAAKQAVALWGAEENHTLSASDAAIAPGILRDDQNACSFTNENIYDLSSIEVPGSTAGKHLSALVGAVTLWSTGDALGIIEDIQTLMSQPSDKTALSDLAKRERQAAQDRSQADAQINGADSVLGAAISRPDLPVLPTPPRS
jgi:hypothetical protein